MPAEPTLAQLIHSLWRAANRLPATRLEEMTVQTSTCRLCGKPIVYVPGVLSRSPLVLSEAEGGPYVIIDGSAVMLADHPLIAERLPEDMQRYESHFSRCPTTRSKQ